MLKVNKYKIIYYETNHLLKSKIYRYKKYNCEKHHRLKSK